MDVSIIIINYNTRNLLIDCIDSIIKHTIDIKYEIIIVDNASIDDSRDIIINKYPSVKWIQSPTNLGFGKANNLGAKEACGKYLFLLNSDTILLNNAIKLFYNWAESHLEKKYGVIGTPLMTSEMKPNTSAGHFIKPTEVISGFFNGLYRRLFNKTRPVYDFEQDVDYVMGADMFMTKDLFNSVHGFDEDFFMYCEEVDLQYRISKLGFINHLIIGPQIIHLDGGSFNEKNNLSFYRFKLWQTSRNIYACKHFSFINKFIWKFSLLILGWSIIFNQKWSLSKKFEAFKLMLK